MTVHTCTDIGQWCSEVQKVSSGIQKHSSGIPIHRYPPQASRIYVYIRNQMKYNAIICGMLCIFHFTVAEFVVNLYLTCAFLQFMYHMIMQAQLLVLHPSAVLCPTPRHAMPCHS